MKTEQKNIDFEKIEKQLDKSKNISDRTKSKIHDEFVRIIHEYGEKTETGYVLDTGGLIICGDWKCVTYVIKLKLIDDCNLKCDIFYSALGGSGDIEDVDFEIKYSINERLFFLKRLIESLQQQLENNNENGTKQEI